MKTPVRWNHRQERVLDAELDGFPLRVVTRPGFPDWDRITPADRLLASSAQIDPDDRVLVCPCGHGSLGVWAAWRSGAHEVSLRDTNAIAVEMAQRTLDSNGLSRACAEVGLPTRPPGRYDVILMPLPKGRDFARLLLLDAFSALKRGGQLFLAGPNRGGIKSVIRDGEALFGPSLLLAYKSGNRVVSYTRDELPQAGLPAIYRTPGMAHGTYETFDVMARGHLLTVCTRPGVFSWRHLDAGTRLLLDELEIRADDTVLDVGCGYGIIGMYAARRATRGHVTLMDSDVIAYQCARESVARNDVNRAEVLLGDGLDAVPGRQFTLIVSNPPFHSGHAVTRSMAEALVRDAHVALRPRGRLVLVANRFLRYDSLMADVFGSVTTLVATPSYHVIEAEKRRGRSAPGRSEPPPTT